MVKDHTNEDYNERIKEKSYMSKGLGLSAMNKNMESYIKAPEANLVVNQRGQKVALPRYYRKKFLTEEERKQKGKYIASEVQKQKQKKEAEIIRQGQLPGLRDLAGKEIRKHLLQTSKKRNIE